MFENTKWIHSQTDARIRQRINTLQSGGARGQNVLFMQPLAAPLPHIVTLQAAMFDHRVITGFRPSSINLNIVVKEGNLFRQCSLLRKLVRKRLTNKRLVFLQCFNHLTEKIFLQSHCPSMRHYEYFCEAQVPVISIMCRNSNTFPLTIQQTHRDAGLQAKSYIRNL